MAKGEYPSDKADQYMLRFPDGMRDKLKVAAAEKKRSLNAEIIARLEGYAAQRVLEEFGQFRSERLEAELAETRTALRELATASINKTLEAALPARLSERVAQDAASNGISIFEQVLRALEQIYPPLKPFSLDWFRDEWLSRITAAAPEDREALIDEANAVLDGYGSFFEIWYRQPVARDDAGEIVMSVKARDERYPRSDFDAL